MLYKIRNKLNNILETSFNRNLIDRKNYIDIKKKKIQKKSNYWDIVSKEIQKAASSKNEKFFFRNWAVTLHLASEDHSLGYKFIKKIRGHKLGEELLNKCQTPRWGSPFLLKRFPFLSPTTASHLANIISIYDSFGNGFRNYKKIVDFGGGYGGLAKCLCEISNNFQVNIIDLPRMLEVQKKYINKTSDFKTRIFFYKNINFLKNKYCLFNASFSFSEVPLIQRKNIEYFIINKCKRIHIVFQNNFNGVDNIKYMKKFALKLRARNWKVSFKPYGYGSGSKYVMYGNYKKI